MSLRAQGRVASAGLVLVSVIALSAAMGGAQQNPAEEDRLKKLGAVRRKAMEQAKLWRRPIFLTPHTYQTVDRQTLAEHYVDRLVPIGVAGGIVHAHGAALGRDPPVVKDR